MENLMWIFVAVLVAVSVFSVIFCIVRGKGASHKKLVCFASMLGVIAAICFGGQAVLNHFGMGWRCAPFNIMLFICAVLSIVTLWCCMNVLILFEKDVNHAVIGCGFISMMLVTIITLISAFGYFQLSSWHDGLTIYNDQTIVYSNDQHGGSCSWRYYDHINSLVHGAEITTIYGWHGNPPRF